MFKLYWNEMAQHQLKGEIEEKQKDLAKMVSKRESIDKKMTKMKKEQGEIQRGLAALDKRIAEVVSDSLKDYGYSSPNKFWGLQSNERSKKSPQLMKTKEKVRHLEKKLDSLNLSLRNAKKNAENHSALINRLQTELDTVKQQKEEFEAEMTQQSQAQGLQLSEDQVNFISKFITVNFI